MLIREPLIDRDIPEPFTGRALTDADTLDVVIGNGDPLAVGADGEAAAIQVEVDREACDGFALVEVPGPDRSVGPKRYERTVGSTLDSIDRGTVAFDRLRQLFSRLQVVEDDRLLALEADFQAFAVGRNGQPHDSIAIEFNLSDRLARRPFAFDHEPIEAAGKQF